MFVGYIGNTDAFGIMTHAWKVLLGFEWATVQHKCTAHIIAVVTAFGRYYGQLG